ncbi:twitching motility protein PilT [Candidatus Desulfofervidus auxilii]|uniref:Twitching motility protein PilT n=1 Tax=Desulfofervidus auxilii TaxID=1621989 RepID=A0A7U4QJQ4_DESA2|nr:type II toxin-antitoxin system VapC family toxin [Candidatus Desulfofervidus auxilii]AMM40596.1 twitching motility protein PilT [Candidatus Desulfofervidus auxilii]
MRVLLDTHTFLWWISNDTRLSSRALEVISNGNNELLLSAASGWEIAIKVRLGRLQLPYEPERFIPEQLVINAIQSLPIKISHALHTYSLPIYHRDPFDRIIIAQAQLEGLPILTSDPQIAKYKVEIIW